MYAVIPPGGLPPRRSNVARSPISHTFGLGPGRDDGLPLLHADTDRSSCCSPCTGHRRRLPGPRSFLLTVTLGFALTSVVALLGPGTALSDASDAAQREDAAASRAALVRDFYTL